MSKKTANYLNRHTAREVALKMIFQLDVGNNTPAMAARTLEEAGLTEELAAFASELALKAFERRQELDGRIGTALMQDWTVDRLANVDRNILRLALYEIYYIDNIPDTVSINEAIELAKSYGSAEAPAFVNGVLDKLAKAAAAEDGNGEAE